MRGGGHYYVSQLAEDGVYALAQLRPAVTASTLPAIRAAVAEGLACADGTRYRLTPRGRAYARAQRWEVL